MKRSDDKKIFEINKKSILKFIRILSKNKREWRSSGVLKFLDNPQVNFNLYILYLNWIIENEKSSFNIMIREFYEKLLSMRFSLNRSNQLKSNEELKRE